MHMMIIVASLLSLGADGEQIKAMTYDLPIPVGVYDQQIHRPYTTSQGLPDNDIQRLGFDTDGGLVAITAGGAAVFDRDQWRLATTSNPVLPPPAGLNKQQLARLEKQTKAGLSIRAVAQYQGEYAVAAASGLYLGNGKTWRMALPRQGAHRWAPVDVRAVTFDASGVLWFASPQGVGQRLSEDEWRLYTGSDGLPYSDFTCMAAGPKGVWLGTSNGAIHFHDGIWSFRQGRRWLLDNHVRDIAVDTQGNAWIATAGGVSCIAFQPMTLAEKAGFYRAEIERYHRRTVFGYVNPADLSTPGDKSTAAPVFTDNDGHGTGLYLGAVALGYAATKDPELKQDAMKAFRALAFLSEVTEGGTHPAPKGFIARSVLPTSEPDPNPAFDLAYDLRRNQADALWKIIQPRWPIDATGEWYWKNDSSSDELDGHFFGYAIYFDRVCETETEKDEVRAVVRRIIDHILAHGYNLVDYDGLPTRWGRFSPDDLNRNEAWCDERGLNSYSILTYLSIAHHITGDPKYREVYLELALDHGYGMNGMTHFKDIPGPDDPGHQPDDNMAFMNYYHLIRYEADPNLLSMYYHAIYRHCQFEKLKRNPFANFVYAACCHGKIRRDHWGETDLTPPIQCFNDGIDTLKRYPLDMIDWPMSNAHRIDMMPLRQKPGQAPVYGKRIDGYAFPIDERHEIYWDRDFWVLTYDGKGLRLREGVHYLLAYYMGRAHGFIQE